MKTTETDCTYEFTRPIQRQCFTTYVVTTMKSPHLLSTVHDLAICTRSVQSSEKRRFHHDSDCCLNCGRSVYRQVQYSSLGEGAASVSLGVNRSPELHQLHSDVSHHESLEERCRILFGCGELGSAICSPDSRWRRIFRETAARKSGRSRIGPFLPDIFKVRYHCCPRYLLKTSVERDDTYGFLLQIRPSLCTFVLTIRLRVVIHDKFGSLRNRS